MEGMYQKLQETVAFVRSRTAMKAAVGIVLGSGLGKLVERITDPVTIEYHEIPHFPVSTVAGHAGRLVFGKIGATEVVAMQGRFHYYEGHPMRTLAYPVAALKFLGVETLVVSNACGGINPGFQAGDLMLITDHINLFADNPLIGLNDERLGPRFPDMTEPYSNRLMSLADRMAAQDGFEFRRGVYAGMSGPYYETAAEIRYLGRIGADAVGMSTVPEVIAARYLGLEVLGVACITNMATGIATVKHSHEAVVATANAAGERFCKVVAAVVANIKEA
jgi:purine-nucleoside phosphorylase